MLRIVYFLFQQKNVHILQIDLIKDRSNNGLLLVTYSRVINRND